MISVIVPVYKVEQYLTKCIESLLAQKFFDFELLLIDDGSPDKSGQICNEYAAKDSRILVFHKENGGVSSARNFGLDKAKGEWIVFVDSDDWVKEDYLSGLYEDQKKFNSDLVMQGLEMINYNQSIVKHSLETRFYNSNEFMELFKLNSLFFHGGPVCKLYNSEIISTHSIRFDNRIKILGDVVFMLTYLLHCTSVQLSDITNYYYRRVKNSISDHIYEYKQEKYVLDMFTDMYAKISIKYKFTRDACIVFELFTVFLTDRTLHALMKDIDTLDHKVLHLSNLSLMSYFEFKKSNTLSEKILTVLLKFKLYYLYTHVRILSQKIKFKKQTLMYHLWETLGRGNLH